MNRASSAIGETSSFAPPLPEVLTNNLSCAEMAVLKVQSDRVNVRVAAEVADYLYRRLRAISSDSLAILMWRVGRRVSSTFPSSRCVR